MAPVTGPLNEGGGFHPRNPARRGLLSWSALHRSMKAGAFTPAIHPRPLVSSNGPSWPLNEGGGFHPRNPVGGRSLVTSSAFAQ